ncbi:MAG TPA: HD domain-containing protein [Terriglobales bacterium]|jgi:GTP pyrophosphokinase|nr:HD domain-containing protein [Terriglobales bacterium]
MKAQEKPHPHYHEPPDPMLDQRFLDGLAYATRLHAQQARKGTRVPYVAHLLGVAAIVLAEGGDEDMAIAALLHDAVEDQGGKPTLREIERRFGKRVARLVEACTDADSVPKPPWKDRKTRYIEAIRHEPADARLISAADKLHNARDILADYRQHGEEVWKRFRGGREGTLWYYRALVEAFRAAGSNRLVDELDRVVAELEHLVAKNGRPATGS